MTKHITQWHKPRECSAACARVEEVMQELKSLVRSLDDDEGDSEEHRRGREYSPQTPTETKHLVDGRQENQRGKDFGRSPLPDIYSHPQCKCGKRNGLQDYCGQSCYMNSKIILDHAPRQNYQDQTEPMKYDEKRRKVSYDSEERGSPARRGDHVPCHECHEGCVGEFYLVPIQEKRH